jgi:hypothetical protein
MGRSGDRTCLTSSSFGPLVIAGSKLLSANVHRAA